MFVKESLSAFADQSCDIISRKKKQRGAKRSDTLIEPLETRLLFSTYTVTSLADDGGTGELRWAVLQADSASNCTFSGDTAGNANTPGRGGGICVYISGSSGTCTISNSTFSGDTAQYGGGVAAFGPSYTCTISNCTFSGDTAGTGGGIFNDAKLTVTNTTLVSDSVTGNGVHRAGDGGGIFTDDGPLSVSNCTFSGDTAAIDGGGIMNGSKLTVINSTFNGNSAGYEGGGFQNYGTTVVTNCTICGNTGGGINAGGDTTLYNMIVAGNTVYKSTTPNDIYGTLDTKSSYNLIGDVKTAGGLTNGVHGNIVGVASADLGTLQNNGGPTKTIALLAGSRAVDAGSNALALDANGKPLTTDQRGAGFPRIVNGTVDMGAFEVQTSPHLVFHTQPTNGTAGTAISSTVVYIENSANSVVTTDNSTVTISVNTGPGALTVKVAAKNGVATFSNDLIFDVSGTYTLAATDGTDKAAVSSSFVIGTAAAAKLVFATSPTNSIAGNYYSPPVVAYVEDAYSNIVRNVTTPVTLSVASGPGKVFGVTTVNLSNGAAIFSDVWFQTAGAYKLTAKDGTLTPIISPTFTISPAAPAKLVFTTLPTTAKHGVAFAVKVSVEDGFGNIVTAQTGGTISLTLATHPASSVLGGTLTTNIVAGIATFSNLTVSLAGTYSLLANNSFGLSATTSNSFVVS
jgi:hypothetical protein